MISSKPRNPETMSKNNQAPPKLNTNRRQLRRFLTDEDVNSLPKHSLRKRQQIIDAAFECFLELGYEGTSMNAVADRAGVIKQTIYSHFNSKECLFQNVIKQATIDFVRRE